MSKKTFVGICIALAIVAIAIATYFLAIEVQKKQKNDYLQVVAPKVSKWLTEESFPYLKEKERELFEARVQNLKTREDHEAFIFDLTGFFGEGVLRKACEGVPPDSKEAAEAREKIEKRHEALKKALKAFFQIQRIRDERPWGAPRYFEHEKGVLDALLKGK
jgi:hypothetical protein